MPCEYIGTCQHCTGWCNSNNIIYGCEYYSRRKIPELENRIENERHTADLYVSKTIRMMKTMARYIDVDIVKTLINEEPTDGLFKGEITNLLDTVSTADVQGVVHGEWMPERAISLKLTAYRCTECRNIYTATTRYCPACGAKMDGGNNDTR